jgi:hypothetical protein
MPEPVSDYQRRLERRAARERGEFVGFLACSHGPGRLLKVALPDQRQRLRVRCPVEGCPEGEHETPNAMPRPRDRGEVCDVGVDGAAPDPAAADPEPGSTAPPRRWRHTDETVLTAVPTETTTALDVAEVLGYATADALVRRLERINARAADDGNPEPVVISKSGAGKPVEIQRREGVPA